MGAWNLWWHHGSYREETVFLHVKTICMCMCISHIVYMWKCGAWNLWWHHGSFGEHTVEQHGVHILPRRACLIVQLATTKIIADCTLTQRVCIRLPVFVGLCVCLLLWDGVFFVCSRCVCKRVYVLEYTCIVRPMCLCVVLWRCFYDICVMTIVYARIVAQLHICTCMCARLANLCVRTFVQLY